jgi:serine acetyltransferase
LVPTCVREGATIGANATIVCGTTIGAHAFVAAGSVVTRDVPAHAFVAGNPARRRGWVSTCGEPLNDALTCPNGHRYELGRTEAAGLTPLA